MRAIALAEYTTAGAAAGALFTGLGAAICHTADPDRFVRSDAALAGLVGGAVTHAALGLMAAFDRDAAHDRLYVDIGRSLPLAALTSGALGGAIVGGLGYRHSDPGALVLAGLIGGGIIGTVVSMAAIVSCLTCTRRPAWTTVGTGDLGRGESLISDVEDSAHRGASDADLRHQHRSLADRIIPWERRSNEVD